MDQCQISAPWSLVVINQLRKINMIQVFVTNHPGPYAKHMQIIFTAKPECFFKL